MTHRQTQLRPSQGGRFRQPVAPSSDVVAAMRAHDDRAPKGPRCDGCGVGEAMLHLDGCPRVTAMWAAPAEPRRWSVEAVRWMVLANRRQPRTAEWDAIPDDDKGALREAFLRLNASDVARDELARLPRWSEREIAYLRAEAVYDTREAVDAIKAFDTIELARMNAACRGMTDSQWRAEAARLVTIHDVLSVVG